MASFMELRGTTFSTFAIGKRGPTLSQISTTGLTIAALPSATITPGGPITLIAGANTSALGDGGAITLTGGTGSLTTGSGGNVNINGGAGAGASLTSNGGDVEINGGTAGGSGGDVVLRSGASVAAAGDVRLIANNSSGVGSIGGDILMNAGSGPTGGVVSVTAGPGAANAGGAVTMVSGTSTSATTGAISISTPNSTANSSGGITIQTGTSLSTGTSGSISIIAGAATVVGAVGGDINITAGDTGSLTQGGNINLLPGVGRRAINILPAGTAAGNTSELRFLELAANGTNYVGLKGPDGPVANTIWTLPATDGTPGQSLTTNGSGAMSWDTRGPGRTRISQWNASGNGIGISILDAGTLTGTGATTAINVATTSLLTMTRRIETLVNTGATNNVAGYRYPQAQWAVGGVAAGVGGFTFRATWSPSIGIAIATHRAFCGMGASIAAPTDVEPSSITNIVGMGWDAADTNIQMMHRNAGAVVKIDLGAAFPVPAVDRSVLYEVVLYSPTGTTQSVQYTVINLTSGAIATGTITTSLPTTATLLAPRMWISVGGTNSVIGLAMAQMSVETRYAG